MPSGHGARRAACLCATLCIVSSTAVGAAPAAWTPVDAVPVGGALSATPERPILLGLDGEALRGRWIRVVADVAAGAPDPLLVVVAGRLPKEPERWTTGRCDGPVDARRCVATAWVPRDAGPIQVAAVHPYRPTTLRALHVDVATVVGSGPPVVDRSADLMRLMRERYFRSDEADWAAIDAALATIPQPPDDIDPRPAVVQHVVSMLPASKHSRVMPAALLGPDQSSPLPTCRPARAAAWVVVVPSIGTNEGDFARRYVDTLNGCLTSAPPDTTWIVDLRGNDGGAFGPMLAGLAPLFDAGRRVAFAAPHEAALSWTGLDRRGVVDDGEVRFRGVHGLGTRSHAAVVVLVDARCLSSCEFTALALVSRPRTLLVGQPTGGYTTANAVHAIDADFTLALTEGTVVAPPGRLVDERVRPDVVVAATGDAAPGSFLGDERVQAWLAGDGATRASGIRARARAAPAVTR